MNRLYRSLSDTMVSGVCGGIARRVKAPVWLVRVTAVLALIVMPVPVAIAYLLAVILLPKGL